MEKTGKSGRFGVNLEITENFEVNKEIIGKSGVNIKMTKTFGANIESLDGLCTGWNLRQWV